MGRGLFGCGDPPDKSVSSDQPLSPHYLQFWWATFHFVRSWLAGFTTPNHSSSTRLAACLAVGAKPLPDASGGAGRYRHFKGPLPLASTRLADNIGHAPNLDRVHWRGGSIIIVIVTGLVPLEAKRISRADHWIESPLATLEIVRHDLDASRRIPVATIDTKITPRAHP